MGQRNTADNRSDNLLSYVIALSGWYAAASSHLREQHSSTLMQYWVLIILQTHGAMSISSLQHLLDVNYTTVAECTASLEKRGLVLKHLSDEDQRCQIAEITPKGTIELDALDKSMYAFSHAAWRNVPKKERERALKLLSKSCEHMNKSRTTRGGLIRGDSAFIVSCTQFSIDLQRGCNKIPTSPRQAKLLLLLSHNREGMRVTDMARVLAKRTSEISKPLAKMEREGLIEREAGASKRERIVRLSDAGYARASAVEQAVRLIFENRFGWLEDRRALFETIEKLAAALPR